MKYLIAILAVFLIKSLFHPSESTLYKKDLPLLEGLERVGLVAPKVVLAQTYLETNCLTSRIYRENHNRFGMKHNKRGYSKGIKNGHAYYESDIDSFMDYLAWQRQMLGEKQIKTDEEYLYFLDHLPGDRRYAEDPKYTDKLRTIMKKFKL